MEKDIELLEKDAERTMKVIAGLRRNFLATKFIIIEDVPIALEQMWILDEAEDTFKKAVVVLAILRLDIARRRDFMDERGDNDSLGRCE